MFATAGAARCAALKGLTPGAGHVFHALHSSDAVWVEKNCYVDIWIELLHALKLDPSPMLGFTLAIDFEGDQWTFLKPAHADLFDLYGLDVQELNTWRPLLDHAIEHLAEGKLLCTEADAWWLPDNAGTTYRQQHSKTTIVLADVDAQARRVGYFHNAGYFELHGDDFDGLFRLGGAVPLDTLPLFAEIIRTAGLVRRSPDELASLSRRQFARHLARRPHDNPVRRFAERWQGELGRLQDEGLDNYHAWAFATLRQLGAAFEMAAHGLHWLQSRGEPHVNVAIESFEAIAIGSKTLILKGARSVTARKPLDDALLADMANAWDHGMAALARHFESPST